MGASNIVLVDSNIWIGIFNDTDSLHEKSSIVIHDLHKKEKKVMITNFIILEVFTILSLRQGQSTAMTFYEYITKNELIQTLDVDSYWLEGTIDFIKEQSLTKKMSIVDYTNLYVSLSFGFELLSFDKQLMSVYKKVIA